MPSYNNVLNSIGTQMTKAVEKSSSTRPAPVPAPQQETTPTLLNKIGLEVQRQGGAR